MTAARRIGDELAWLDGLIRRVRAHAEHLSDREIRFVDDSADRIERFAGDTFLSPRQRDWLESIGRRLDAAGVPADGDDPGDAVARPVDERFEE